MQPRMIAGFAFCALLTLSAAMAPPLKAAPASPAAGDPGAMASAPAATSAGDPAFGEEGAGRPPRHHRRQAGDIAVPIAFFVMVVMLVGLIQLLSYRKDRVRHETLRVMVERGAEIPMALLSPPRKRASSDLRKGVIWLAVGVGVMGALALLTAHEEHNPWAIGLVPTLIGLGYLVVHRLERGHRGDPGTSDPQSAEPMLASSPRSHHPEHPSALPPSPEDESGGRSPDADDSTRKA